MCCWLVVDCRFKRDINDIAVINIGKSSMMSFVEACQWLSIHDSNALLKCTQQNQGANLT